MPGLRHVLTWLALFSWYYIEAQGLNNLWMGGYDSQVGLPWGGTNIEFAGGGPNIYYVNREMGFGRTSANITDSAGNLLFYTNGYYIANANGDTLVNGTGINPSAYTALTPTAGLNLAQNAFIIPAPGSDHLYFLFHGTLDDQIGSNADYLYLSIVDMDLQGGLGEVVLKNHILIQDELNPGRITGVKHANGRDWWVFCHKQNSNTYYRMLVTPAGVGLPSMQDIGVVRPADGGQMCFSPDGSKFAYYWGIEDLDIFSFDRCSGLFYDAVHVDIDDGNATGGVAFSPSSEFLYVSSFLDVYQFDVTAADIPNSLVHIAEWDTFYSPAPPLATVFDIAQLAPDGKIYIGTGNATLHLHVIHDPDVPGLGCNMEQHGLELPTYYQSTLPNHPNYHLGALVGSPCDTLGVGINEAQRTNTFSLYPNPAMAQAVLQYDMNGDQGGFFEMFDVVGRKVIGEVLPPGKGLYHFDTSDMPQGTYHYAVWSVGEVQGTGVFVVVH